MANNKKREFIIAKEFTFDSAHVLPWHKGKCKNLHGHTYKIVVSLKGNLNKNGIVVDFGELKKVVKKRVLTKLDHKYLNEIIENPTAEQICLWAWEQLEPVYKSRLYEIIVWETPTSLAKLNKEE